MVKNKVTFQIAGFATSISKLLQVDSLDSETTTVWPRILIQNLIRIVQSVMKEKVKNSKYLGNFFI